MKNNKSKGRLGSPKTNVLGETKTNCSNNMSTMNYSGIEPALNLSQLTRDSQNKNIKIVSQAHKAMQQDPQMHFDNKQNILENQVNSVVGNARSKIQELNVDLEQLEKENLEM